MLVALAHAVLLQRQGDKDKDGKLAGQLEEAAQAVKYVFSQCPSYDELIPALLNHPISVSSFLPDVGTAWHAQRGLRKVAQCTFTAHGNEASVRAVYSTCTPRNVFVNHSMSISFKFTSVFSSETFGAICLECYIGCGCQVCCCCCCYPVTYVCYLLAAPVVACCAVLCYAKHQKSVILFCMRK